MSQYTRNQQVKDSVGQAQSMLTKVQAEMAQNYIEVEAEGISLMRLGCVYLAGLLDTKDRLVHGVRSLFRFHPAH